MKRRAVDQYCQADEIIADQEKIIEKTEMDIDVSAPSNYIPLTLQHPDKIEPLAKVLDPMYVDDNLSIASNMHALFHTSSKPQPIQAANLTGAINNNKSKLQ